MKRISLSLLLLLSASLAHADLSTASRDYAAQKYDEALREFRELAELGQPVAQYNLAVMYENGQGAPLSNTYAHAWASLARGGGEPHAAALVEKLEPLLSPTSLRISAEIQAKFSPSTLNARLMPQFLDKRDFADRDPVRLDKAYTQGTYPQEAQRLGIQGQVYLEFIVAADGHARLPRIVYAIPEGVFDESAREIILRTSFLPARVAGAPVAAIAGQLIEFKMLGVSKEDYPDLPSLMSRTLAKAQAGDASAQMLYGMLLAGLPQVRQPFSEALPWFLKAAQAGAPYAQYQVGAALLHGRGCQCEEIKGEVWLERAAQADQADAQVSLAEHFLKDTPTKEHVASAQLWLERAANKNNAHAKLMLAALLATSPASGEREPKRALQLVNQSFRALRDDPSAWETRAAALAADGNFRAAVKEQTAAIDLARRLHWDLTALEARLSAYSSGRPWNENLLSF